MVHLECVVLKQIYSVHSIVLSVIHAAAKLMQPVISQHTITQYGVYTI